ncbi:MAG: nucleotidyltransferase family protein [Janthinobacterium lividum]
MKSSLSTALLMAGGRSVRMREGGDTRHKALRSVLGRPLIAWNIHALLAHGFSDIVVALNQREPALAAWIESEGALLAHASGARCTVLLEDEPLGTIGAIARLPTAWTNLMVTNVDNLTDLHLRDLADRHLASGAAATVATHIQPFRIPFGRLDIEGDFVVDYHEKPTIPVAICSGTTVFARRATAHVAQDGVTDLPTLVQTLIHAGERVCTFPHQSRWIDVNDESTLASADVLLRDAGASWPGNTSSAPIVSDYELGHA